MNKLFKSIAKLAVESTQTLTMIFLGLMNYIVSMVRLVLSILSIPFVATDLALDKVIERNGWDAPYEEDLEDAN